MSRLDARGGQRSLWNGAHLHQQSGPQRMRSRCQAHHVVVGLVGPGVRDVGARQLAWKRRRKALRHGGQRGLFGTLAQFERDAVYGAVVDAPDRDKVIDGGISKVGGRIDDEPALKWK